MDWITDLILKTMIKAFSDALYGVIDYFSDVLNQVFKATSSITSGDYVRKLTEYTFTLAAAILIFLAIIQLIKLYILPDSGDPEENISGFFIRLGKSAVLMACSANLCEIIETLTDKIATDVLVAVSGSLTINLTDSLKGGIDTTGALSFPAAFNILLISLIVIICMIVVICQACLRGVELVVLQILAPLFATNYLSADKGLWNKWLQTMLSVSLTYVFQILLVNIGLKFLVLGITDHLLDTLVGIAWIVTAIKAPKLLKEFAYSSGTGNAMKSAGSAVVSVVKMIK